MFYIRFKLNEKELELFMASAKAVKQNEDTLNELGFIN